MRSRHHSLTAMQVSRAVSRDIVGALPVGGHVHQLGVGWRADTHQRRYELTAALAVSSNALKHPGDLEAEDVRPDGCMKADLWPVGVFARPVQVNVTMPSTGIAAGLR